MQIKRMFVIVVIYLFYLCSLFYCCCRRCFFFSFLFFFFLYICSSFPILSALLHSLTRFWDTSNSSYTGRRQTFVLVGRKRTHITILKEQRSQTLVVWTTFTGCRIWQGWHVVSDLSHVRAHSLWAVLCPEIW